MDGKKSKYVFEHPECWKDETRMNALFAPFRDREVNPIFYDVKMKFWKDLIQEACSNVGYFTIQELNTAFTRNRRIPYCTANIVKDLIMSGDVRTKEEFLKSTPGQSWKKWAVQTVVVNPLYWSFSKIKQTMGYEQNDVEVLDNKEYVHIPAIKKKSESLLSTANEAHVCGKVFAFEELRQKIAKSEDSASFNLYIHWLHLTGMAVTMIDPNDNKTQLVKLAEPGDKAKPVTEQELAIYSLQYNENKLSKSIEKLESEKEELILEAKAFLKKGMRQSAKNCLRKKKDLEKRIDKQAASLENIQCLLDNVRDAESNNRVVESYKYGLAALKSTFQEAGTTADNVADTMDEVKDMLEQHDEIKESIGSPLSPTVDELELEDELAELLANNVGPSPLSKLLNDFPVPPSESPTSSPSKENLSNTSKMQKVRKLEAL
ncbi:hypothetical protein M8J75_000552 [Diaphorina citri]|nr:hypothetical protein M8J75_000552 [Diaphorina citri]